MVSVKSAVAISMAVLMAGCATVRQSDLDAWVGMPVEALDTHSFFLTVPLYKSMTSSGIEVRNYANGGEVARCYSNAMANTSKNSRYVNANAFSTCSSIQVVCNNIFYIKDGRVLEYAPTGRCYTDDTVLPQKRYIDLQKK